MPDPSLPQISPEELKSRIDSGNPPFILDVRNPDEFALGRIIGSSLIPLGELPARLGELDPDSEIVVHCKMGGRATQAQIFLQQHHFRDVKNLTGGILAWSEKIDPSIPKY
ncbi:rhodanese-like domain-containing protein [bacterium]|nr:rhodanese-like domain-containing protein [bacterium]